MYEIMDALTDVGVNPDDLKCPGMIWWALDPGGSKETRIGFKPPATVFRGRFTNTEDGPFCECEGQVVWYTQNIF